MLLSFSVYNSHFLYCIRILVALTGAVLLSWWLNQPTLTVSLTLGVVAAASTDIDDRLTNRLINLIITLFCFFVASVSVELLFPYPLLFILGFLISTFVFIFLGVLGQRYATIAFGALLIATYTILGKDTYSDWYQQPLLLLAGALWYNLISLIGHLFFPIRPVQDNLASCFNQLGQYLDYKAMLFDPDEEDGFKQQILNLIMANKALVTTLNQTKTSLFSRLKNGRAHRMLNYYFIAQDIHERSSSAHGQYQALSIKFRHSDILFRFQRIISQQAIACRNIASNILSRQKYTHSPLFERLFQRLDESLSQLEIKSKTDKLLHNSLQNLLNNLRTIDQQLANINAEQALFINASDNTLSNDNLADIKDVFLRIKQNLTPKSTLFRHAVRMQIVFFVGYIIIQLTELQNGYWIILTSLFVCQPNYTATKYRLKLRTLGTVVGILIGIPILYIVPSYEGQMVLIVISGVLFFAFRNIQYAYATGFMTLLVLFCFNLLGEGSSIAIPRIVATLIGCGLSWAAITYIWPDWKFRGLSQIVKKTCNANSLYLSAIDQQYHQGKDNHVTYRIARRDAHTYNVEFASAITNMSVEPHANKTVVDLGFRLLNLNHMLLSHISTLGSHREKVLSKETLLIFDQATHYIIDTLHFEKQTTLSYENVVEHTQQMAESLEHDDLLICQQILLILGLLPEFIQIAQDISNE